ncbi:MAG: (Fe-S)-binding protein [Ignavibacteriales bacterium]|nr:(Fe-S)-binding protein [Ignavibacteriales bacterium]
MNPLLKSHLEEIFNKCLHCGLCLPTCPTYNINLREESSPRGRIQQMHYVQSGKIPLSKTVVDELYFCLDCQACETACPAGVRYGELVEDARNLIHDSKKDPLGIRLIKKLFLNGILISNERTKLFGKFLRFYERSGLRNAIEESGILKLFSNALSEKIQLLPSPNEMCFSESIEEIIPATTNKSRGRVAFLSGCIMNIAFGETHRDSIRVLTLNGYDVVIPKNQVCCGSLHAHNGELEKAKKLAKKNIEIFEKHEFDTLVIDSAGCSAFMKEYGKIFEDEPEYKNRAIALSSKVREITEFLSEVGLKKSPDTLNISVTYHEACHLVHTQKISRQPRELLQNIPGITFVELPESTWCCGSAGIYNIVRYDDSMKILDRKMENIKSTHADIVTTANPGCHIQLQYGIAKNGLKMEVLHPISVLSRAYK